ncbi:YvcK family protein [Candidatus Pacearchaeota archaeon]|nr:YvcK family protein [Candidatus Pacearchaeota archaeon]
MQRVVTIGGGTGHFAVLEGLKNRAELTAIVTSFDSGGSSGKLREEFGTLPFGDLRRCLVALSDSEQLMRDLFEYRYSENGSLQNHVFGNIFMLTLVKVTGSYESAIEELGKILAIKGKVLPCTLEDKINLCAELDNGKIVKGEDKVGQYKLHYNLEIKRVFLEPQPDAYKKAVKEIQEADKIVIGPGSLYTSIIPNLLVRGIPEAIKQSQGKKIYVVNIMTEHGETDNFTASKYVSEISKYLGDGLHYVIVNTEIAPEDLKKLYEEEYKYQVEADIENLKSANYEVVIGDFLRHSNLLRHDKDKLAKAILDI